MSKEVIEATDCDLPTESVSDVSVSDVSASGASAFVSVSGVSVADVSRADVSVLSTAQSESVQSAMRPAKRLSVSLLSCFAINSLSYLAFALYYKSSLVDAKYVNHHISNLIVTIPGVVLLLWSYWRGYRAIQEDSTSNLKSIVVLGLVSAAIAVCIPNFHSSDVFSYIDVGWLQSNYHLNPYVTTVDEIPNFRSDSMLTGVWAWNPCPYGFAFAGLMKLVCQLGGGNLAMTALLMKCINFGAFVATAALIYCGSKRFGVSKPEVSLYLYLWSPFVLIQSLANAHNDVLMTLFVMIALFCASVDVATLPLLALSALVVSAQIKFLWLVSVPFLALFLYRKFGPKALAMNLLAATAMLAALASPYIADFSHFRFDIMRQDLSFNGKSLPALVENIAHGVERMIYHSTTLPWFEQGLNQGVSALKAVIFAGFAGFCIVLFGKALKTGRNYSVQSMLRDSLLLALLAVCVVSSKFHPWYILMFFPVALWMPERSELRKLAIILSCTQLFAITYLGHSGGINYVLLTATPLVIFLGRYLKSRRAGISE
ncbi:MAG: hypothetical protein JST44_17930 [Cyanobacteria bacterium SZAS LIN-5]|nr:hypothetical protein [Cyanobacteria bacterium SZAS LIN-5]